MILTADGTANRQLLRSLLGSRSPVTVDLPPGRWPVAGGIVLHAGQSLRGTPETTLVLSADNGDPLVHIVGSGVAVSDVTFELPAAVSGRHQGHRHTAVTIGDYLYGEAPAWIEHVAVENVRVRRDGPCPANSIAVMGAVRDVVLNDLDISGGGTALAVHWGAVAADVSAISGPSFHPHRLAISGLRVKSAFEAFYLSSCHDVTVRDVTADDVEIGFRLLPGDNGTRFQTGPSRVSSSIDIAGCEIGWRGLYAIRVAGWGRSEVDQQLTTVTYQDTSISDCRLTATRSDGPIRRIAAIVIEQADGVKLDDIEVSGLPPGVPRMRVDGDDVSVAHVT